MVASPGGVTGAGDDQGSVRLPGDRLGWATCLAAAAGFVLCLFGWLAGGGAVSLPWAPSLNLRLSFALDGLGALYGLLATGVGALVFAYGTRYLSLHLRHQRRPAAERWRFWPWMALFAVAMVGLATAQDLVLVFVFFDLTAVCSYFLIGFDRAERESRTAALMALLVTVVAAVAMLVAAVLLYAAYGTFSIPELLARAGPGSTTTVAAALLAVAALAKSAQAPLHFWLPRAMAAPTPVSAYLHSAAMVAAGVLVIGRVYPLLARSQAVLTGLLVVGATSIVVGGVLALRRDVLKQILAYSTISQYGYMVMLYGIGGTDGAGAAAFYVLAHGIAKSALFMTAGAVTMATGEDRLSRMGGLGPRAPALAVAAGAAAATLAALPLTMGFFKDELLFSAALSGGPVTAVLAVVAAALTFAYIGRFWMGLFLGPVRGEVSATSRLLVAPVVILAAVAVLGGVFVEPFAALAGDAAGEMTGRAVALSPSYHLDFRPENLMALAGWGLGALLIAMPRVSGRMSEVMAAAGERVGPRRCYEATLRGLVRISAALHDREVRDLRTSIAAVLVPAGLLTALAFAATPTAGAYFVGAVSGADWVILPLLALVVIVTVMIVRSRSRLSIVLALAVVGFALAAVYALVGAPDVALVAVAVETVLTLVFVAALARIPRDDLGAVAEPARVGRRRRDALAGGIAGLAAFATVWGFLSQPATDSVSEAQIRLTPAAHGGDVVTVIVADFRGLDTLVEITVLLAAVIGVATLLRRGRLWGVVRNGRAGRKPAPKRADGDGPAIAAAEHRPAGKVFGWLVAPWRLDRGRARIATSAVVTPGAGNDAPSAIVRVVARQLPGPALMIAIGLIVKGYVEVGDGFAAGVIVALAIGLSYVAVGAEAAEAALPMLRHAPKLAVGGLLLALASGFFALALGEAPVTHRPAPDESVVKIGTLELFTPLAFDVGIFLLVVGVLTMLLHHFARPHGEGHR